MDEKVRLVDKHRDKHGHNRCCELVGLSKGTWHYRQNGHGSDEPGARYREPIEEIIETHPAYGYRRIRRELREEYGLRVNHKPLKRWLREWDLALKREVNEPSRSEVEVILEEASGQLNKVQGRLFGPLEVLSGESNTPAGPEKPG